MKSSIIVLLLCFLIAPPLSLADEAQSSTAPAAASKVPGTFVRTDSLEMPGVTACHQCEWRPKPNNMAAAEQCGVGPDGQARLGEFACGFSEDCQRVCNFVRCNP